MDITCFLWRLLWVLGASLISGIIGWFLAKRGKTDVSAQTNMELENLKLSSSNELVKMKNKFEEADRSRVKADTELEDLRNKYIQLQNTKPVVKQSSEAKDLVNSMKSLEEKLAKANTDNTNLKKELKAQPKLSAKSTSTLKAQVARLSKNNTKLTNALKQKDSIISKSAQTHKDKASALNKNISTLKAEIRSLNKKAPKVSNTALTRVEAKLKKVTLANGTLSAALKQKEQEIKRLKPGSSKVTKLSKELDKLKKQLKDRDAKIKSQGSKSKELSSKMKTASKKQESKLKKELKEAKKSIKKLKKELSQGVREVEVTRSIDMAELKKLLDNDKLTKTTKKVVKKKK